MEFFELFSKFEKLRNLKVISRFFGHRLGYLWTKNDRGQFCDLVPYFHNVTQSLQRVALNHVTFRHEGSTGGLPKEVEIVVPVCIG